MRKNIKLLTSFF